jgi:hypothetical protein
MGYGEHHVASLEGRYGSVHIMHTISGRKKTGSQVKAVRVLFIAGAPHPFSRRLQVRLCTTLSGISAGDCIRPCVRENGKEKSDLVMP